MFKGGAIRLEKILDEEPSNIVIHAQEKQSASMLKVASSKPTATDPQATPERERHLEYWIGAAYEATLIFESICDKLRSRLGSDHEIESGMGILKRLGKTVDERMKPIIERYGENKEFGVNVSMHMNKALFDHQLSGTSTYEVLVAMQSLYMYIAHMESHFTALVPASQAMWDKEFVEAVKFSHAQIGRMQAWVNQQIKVRSPQTLIVPTHFIGKKSF
jgi:hypothetical protein